MTCSLADWLVTCSLVDWLVTNWWVTCSLAGSPWRLIDYWWIDWSLGALVGWWLADRLIDPSTDRFVGWITFSVDLFVYPISGAKDQDPRSNIQKSHDPRPTVCRRGQRRHTDSIKGSSATGGSFTTHQPTSLDKGPIKVDPINHCTRAVRATCSEKRLRNIEILVPASTLCAYSEKRLRNIKILVPASTMCDHSEKRLIHI